MAVVNDVITTQASSTTADVPVGQGVVLDLEPGAGGLVALQFSGTFTGTFVVQGKVNPEANWITLGGTPIFNQNTQAAAANITAGGLYSVNVAGMSRIRVISTAAVTGTARVGAQQVATAPQGPPSVSQSGTWTVSTTPVTPTQTFHNSAATTNATSVKNGSGSVWAVTVSNTNAAARHLKLYNKASAPTVGTDVPVLTIPIPPGSVVSLNLGRAGLRFGTGIAFAITAAAADSDTTAVAASEVKVAIAWT